MVRRDGGYRGILKWTIAPSPGTIILQKTSDTVWGFLHEKSDRRVAARPGDERLATTETECRREAEIELITISANTDKKEVCGISIY